jgi:hypothetical protein
MTMDRFTKQRPPIGPGNTAGPACPDDATLAACVDGNLPSSERTSLEVHLSECDYCRETVTLALRADQHGSQDPVPELWLARARRLVARQSGRHEVPRYRAVWAAAAVLLLAVTTITFFRTADQFAGADKDWSETRQSRLLPGASQPLRITAPLDSAEVSASRFAIQWNPAPGASAYVVRIVDEDGDIVLDHPVGQATEWIPEVPAELEPGRHYFVRIDAYSDGSRVQSSAHVLFKVRD